LNPAIPKDHISFGTVRTTVSDNLSRRKQKFAVELLLQRFSVFDAGSATTSSGPTRIRAGPKNAAGEVQSPNEHQSDQHQTTGHPIRQYRRGRFPSAGSLSAFSASDRLARP